MPASYIPPNSGKRPGNIKHLTFQAALHSLAFRNLCFRSCIWRVQRFRVQRLKTQMSMILVQGDTIHALAPEADEIRITP
jgi:hypothetical protein